MFSFLFSRQICEMKYETILRMPFKISAHNFIATYYPGKIGRQLAFNFAIRCGIQYIRVCLKSGLSNPSRFQLPKCLHIIYNLFIFHIPSIVLEITVRVYFWLLEILTKP